MPPADSATKPPPLAPARLAFSPDGTPYSADFDDIYHSSAGGLGQARHVFLGGNKLPQAWAKRNRFVIVETGFGLGLNFLATWQAWRNDAQRCANLEFVSFEKHPFVANNLATLHQHWPELAELSAELQRQWPELLPGIHRIPFDNGKVTLTLILGDALEWLPEFTLPYQADAFFLDGFSPSKNPELWSADFLKLLAKLAAPEATLATWSVAAAVRRSMAAAGFTVAKAPGYADKREMLIGQRKMTAPL